MSLPLRAVGNMARANPRHYSTHAENAFVHRKAPTVPVLDHMLVPANSVLSYLSARVHVLGSAVFSYVMPWAEAAPSARPVMTLAETPSAYDTALQIVNEQHKQWSWNEQGKSVNNKLSLRKSFAPVERVLLEIPKLFKKEYSSILSFHYETMYTLAAADVVLSRGFNFNSDSEYEQSESVHTVSTLPFLRLNVQPAFASPSPSPSRTYRSPAADVTSQLRL